MSLAKKMYTKVVNDPIHGHIELDMDQLRIMDTPQFQRLRDLKQLGSAYFVFLGASHNRFEHSVGVSHLATQLLQHLHRNQQSQLDLNERDFRCVKLAGLCHDLGHGPFSHVFDSEFIPRARPGLQWTHEQGSEYLLDHLIDDNGVDLDTEDIQFVKELIQGEPRNNRKYDEKMFLFDIVANKRNSVDVDKFDYIQRDCFNVGLKSSYDPTRLIWYSRVIDDQICFNQKEVYNLYEMFHTRFSLFKRIYTHKVGKAVELMIVDALLAADPFLDISGCIDDPERYANLTDGILREIEKSREPELLPARQIIHRLRKRQLYKFVDEFTMPSEMKNIVKSEFVTPELIANYHRGAELKASDIIVDWLSVNYGMKGENPVDRVKFFGKWNQDEAFKIPRHKVSYIVPERYEDITIRIFARDPEKVPQIQVAFREMMTALTRQLRVAQTPTESPVRLSQSSSLTSVEERIASLEASPQAYFTEFEPNPLTTVPSKAEWQYQAELRGWSPQRVPMPRARAISKPNRINLLDDIESLEITAHERKI